MDLINHTSSLYKAGDLQKIYKEKKFMLEKGYVGAGMEVKEFDIFLSHSFFDMKIILGLYLDLTLKKYKVYVDWLIDKDLKRGNVTRENAERIRDRMRASKSLLLAIPTNNVISKWIPWELGYVDGFSGKCAVIPISETNDNTEQFHRAEYLQLYPYLVNHSYGSNQFPYIRNLEDADLPFESWLKL